MTKAIAFLIIAGLVAVFPINSSYGQTGQSGDLANAVPAIADDSCTGQKPGDANSDGKQNMGDMIYLVKFLYDTGPAPVPLANGDFNGDCVIDSLDVKAAFDYVWKCSNAEKCGGLAPVNCACVEPRVGDLYHDPCFGSLSGDVNADTTVNVGDVVYLINYIFKSGYSPQPFYYFTGDANHDCTTNVGDIVFLLNYIFKGGPPPGDCDEWIQSCGRCEDLIYDWLFMH